LKKGWHKCLIPLKLTHHSDEKPGLLGGTPDTCVSDNTNGETGGKTSKTDRETSTELDETSVQWHGGCDWMSAGAPDRNS
jgi:hypothetical protein